MSNQRNVSETGPGQVHFQIIQCVKCVGYAKNSAEDTTTCTSLQYLPLPPPLFLSLSPSLLILAAFALSVGYDLISQSAGLHHLRALT